MKRSYFLFLTSISILFGSATLFGGFMQNQPEPEYIKRCDEVTGLYALNMYKKYGYVLSGGGGGFIRNINHINVNFDAEKAPDIAEVRKDLVISAEELLHHLNNAPKIRNDLVEYPFPVNRIEVCLTFFDKNHKFVKPDAIAYASLIEGRVRYTIFKDEELVRVHRESYEEALQKSGVDVEAIRNSPVDERVDTSSDSETNLVKKIIRKIFGGG